MKIEYRGINKQVIRHNNSSRDQKKKKKMKKKALPH